MKLEKSAQPVSVATVVVGELQDEGSVGEERGAVEAAPVSMGISSKFAVQTGPGNKPVRSERTVTHLTSETSHPGNPVSHPETPPSTKEPHLSSLRHCTGNLTVF